MQYAVIYLIHILFFVWITPAFWYCEAQNIESLKRSIEMLNFYYAIRHKTVSVVLFWPFIYFIWYLPLMLMIVIERVWAYQLLIISINFLACLFTVLVCFCFVFPLWSIYFVLHTWISFDSSFALRPKNVIYPTRNDALTIMPSIGIEATIALITRFYVLYCSIIYI